MTKAGNVSCSGRVLDAGAKNAVFAMFAPRLGDRFEFGIGRVTIKLLEIRLNGLHFDKRKIKLAFFAEQVESIVV